MNTFMKLVDKHYREYSLEFFNKFGEDATQEAYTRIMEMRAKNEELSRLDEDEDQLHYYLIRCLTSAAADMHRDEQRNGTVGWADVEDVMADAGPDPETQALFHEVVDLLEAREPGDAEILSLHFRDGMSSYQISKLVPQSPRTIQRMCNQFKERMHEELK